LGIITKITDGFKRPGVETIKSFLSAGAFANWVVGIFDAILAKLKSVAQLD